MSDTTGKKKSGGRPEGYRKPNAKRAKLPAFHVEEDLERWVVEEASRRRISLSNFMRIVLWEEKERQDKKNTAP